MLIRVGPHQTKVGIGFARQILTAARNVSGQTDIAPVGVLAQSKRAIRSDIVGLTWGLDTLAVKLSGLSVEEVRSFEMVPPQQTNQILVSTGATEMLLRAQARSRIRGTPRMVFLM